MDLCRPCHCGMCVSNGNDSGNSSQEFLDIGVFEMAKTTHVTVNRVNL